MALAEQATARPQIVAAMKQRIPDNLE